nr:GNAT family N-acetyltransferase [Bradyrhizobium tropiciagri]
MLSPERFDRMINAASVATFIAPGKASLLAFEQRNDYDGTHFKWFCSRYDRFLYVDRVVVDSEHRGMGHGRTLYIDLFARAKKLGHEYIVCEVNVEPPNPGSDRFHFAQGFREVGRAVIDNGAKSVHYLLLRQ